MVNKRREGPRVTCRICGQKAKRITDKHLKVHGLTVAEYRETYEDVTIPATANGTIVNRGELFDDLADWIAQDSQLTPLARKVVDSLLLDEGRRFNVILRAVAAAKLGRMKDMLTALDKVEDKLYDPAKIEEMTTPQLFKLKQMLDTDLTGFTDLLLRITDRSGTPGQVNLTAIVDQRTQVLKTDDFPLPSSPQERAQLLQAFNQLKAMASGNGDVIDVVGAPA